MTATSAPAVRPQPLTRGSARGAARLLSLELRHNAMPWLLPLVAVLFWVTTYRKAMALPPLWSLRATTLQTGSLLTFIGPVTGAAAWMASRDGRRHTGELVAITARPRWARLLTAWAATTCWALAGYLACVAVLYGVTAGQGAGGGPLWWPAVIGAAGLPAFAAIGLAAGTALPGRLTAPLAAIAAFFVLALSTELIVGSHSYWQVSPIVSTPWDVGPEPGAAAFYPYLPDLPITQIMFLVGLTLAALSALGLPAQAGGRWLRRAAAAGTAAGLVAAGTAVGLAGTGRLNAHGLIAIPALHDAASDRPVHYRPVCRQAPIPVCLNPVYGGYLPGVAAALRPVLSEIAGLPGAPTRVSQVAATYQQGRGNELIISAGRRDPSGQSSVYRMLLPDEAGGPPLTTSEMAAGVRSSTGPSILASVIGARGGSPAQQAALAGLNIDAGLPLPGSPRLPARCRARGTTCSAPLPGSGAYLPPTAAGGFPAVRPGSPADAAARRFAALPAATRHAWLARHLTALRAGQITLKELP